MSFPSLALLWHRGSLGLPQVVVDGESIHAHRHGFGWDHIELFSVRAVLIEFINHFLGDALWPCPSQLVDLLRVGVVAVKCSELAAGIAEQDDVVVGITFLQLLQQKKKQVQGLFTGTIMPSFQLNGCSS